MIFVEIFPAQCSPFLGILGDVKLNLRDNEEPRITQTLSIFPRLISAHHPHVQDDPELPGLSPPPILHLRVRGPDVLVRVGHSRHLSGAPVMANN